MRTLIFVAALFAASPAISQVHGTECRASATAFRALQNGMTYQQVRDIIGCEGVLLSSTEMAGYSTHMIAWDGKGSMGANMNIMIQNGKLMMKSQFGLR